MEKPDKREEIVRAARALIAVHGFHGAPLAMIADKAGVGTGTIYLYFENKDVLIAAIYKDIEDRLSPLIMAGYAPEKPFRERFLHSARRCCGTSSRTSRFSLSGAVSQFSLRLRVPQ